MKRLLEGLPPLWVWLSLIAIDVGISWWSGHLLIGGAAMFAAYVMAVFAARDAVRKQAVTLVLDEGLEAVKVSENPPTMAVRYRAF
jgi:hypothetical protein